MSTSEHATGAASKQMHNSGKIISISLLQWFSSERLNYCEMQANFVDNW